MCNVIFSLYRLASVQTQVILSGGKDINDPKVMSKMLVACEVSKIYLLMHTTTLQMFMIFEIQCEEYFLGK